MEKYKISAQYLINYLQQPGSIILVLPHTGISPKLCLLGQNKNTGTWVVNTIIEKLN